MPDTFHDYADAVSDIIGEEIVKMIGDTFPMVLALAPEEFPNYLRVWLSAGIATAFGMVEPGPPAGQLELPL
jgi:uncharacterized lipoprotein YbaY